MNPLQIWAKTSSYPERPGNSLDLYVDGQESFAAICKAIQEAKQYVYATFAYIDFGFKPEPDKSDTTLFQLLSAAAKAGVDVRTLIWSPASKTDGTIPDPGLTELPGTNAGPGTVQARWDVARGKFPFPAFVGCHHQKSFIIDGQIAFVGGINSYQPYWDTTGHIPNDDHRVPYSVPRPVVQSALDAAPPLHDLFGRIQGPSIGDVEANFCERWNGATFKHSNWTQDAVPHAGAAPVAANLTLQITRTIAPSTYHTRLGGETSIRESYLNAVRAAQSLIYFEDQYYFDEDVDEAILNAANRGVKVIGFLCRKPDTGTPLGIVEKALALIGKSQADFEDYFKHENIALFSPITAMIDPKNTNNYIYTDIYVHAKLLIVDDLFLTLGSANISFTSMDFHSELNFISNDAVVARSLRKRLWEEHFQCGLTDTQLDDPKTSFDLWWSNARQNQQARASLQKPVSRIYPFK
jgi:phosphatidylserine/phosphatidylglycerophosphate/cardiolipin synthase-like enzyme